jgi:predicted NAD/FAD-dependent oxidoreductase
MSKRVLIVGAGITGAAVYRFLRTLVPQANLVISVWEAQTSVGGRMATDRFSGPHRCDLGAQYISRAISGVDENSDMYCYLLNTGALHLLPRNEVVHGMRPEHLAGRHYIAPQGTASIVSSLLQDAAVHTSTQLRDLQVDAEKGTVTATQTNGISEEFDVVVMATPVKSMLNVLDNTNREAKVDTSVSLPAEVMERLRRVTYSSRYENICTYLSASLPPYLSNTLISIFSYPGLRQLCTTA